MPRNLYQLFTRPSVCFLVALQLQMTRVNDWNFIKRLNEIDKQSVVRQPGSQKRDRWAGTHPSPTQHWNFIKSIAQGFMFAALKVAACNDDFRCTKYADSRPAVLSKIWLLHMPRPRIVAMSSYYSITALGPHGTFESSRALFFRAFVRF